MFGQNCYHLRAIELPSDDKLDNQDISIQRRHLFTHYWCIEESLNCRGLSMAGPPDLRAFEIFIATGVDQSRFPGSE
jgi:hypothetical protein